MVCNTCHALSLKCVRKEQWCHGRNKQTLMNPLKLASVHMPYIRICNRCVTYAYAYVTVTYVYECHMSNIYTFASNTKSSHLIKVQKKSMQLDYVDLTRGLIDQDLHCLPLISSHITINSVKFWSDVMVAIWWLIWMYTALTNVSRMLISFLTWLTYEHMSHVSIIKKCTSNIYTEYGHCSVYTFVAIRIKVLFYLYMR